MKTQIYILLLLVTFTLQAKKTLPLIATHVAVLQEVGINYLNFARSSDWKITLFKQGEIPKILELTETSYPPGACIDENTCSVPPTHTKRYKITKVKPTACGGSKLVAKEVIDKSPNPISTLILLDHSQSMCDMDINSIWQVTVKTYDAPIRKFQGNPTRIPSSLDCSNVGKETVCTMQFAPATCHLKTWDNVLLNPPLSAAGGNSCLAESNLRIAACERGLNYNHLDRQNVICLQTICPLPMCAAPPEGCTYITDLKINSNGCPQYPCGVLKCN